MAKSKPLESDEVKPKDVPKPLGKKVEQFPTVRKGVKEKGVSTRHTMLRYTTLNGVVRGLDVEPRPNQSQLTAVVRDLEKRDQKLFEKFVTYFLIARKSKDRRLTDSKIAKIKARMFKDGNLKTLFIKWMKIRTDYSPNAYLEKKQLLTGIQAKMYSFLPVRKVIKERKIRMIDTFHGRFYFIETIKSMRDKIFVTKHKGAIKIWRKGIRKLRKDCEKGNVTRNQVFLDRLYEIFDKAVEATQNNDLQKSWKAFRKQSEKDVVEFVVSTAEKLEVRPQNAKDKPIKKKKEGDKAMKQAVAEVSGVVGLEVDRNSAGHATVVINGGEFIVSMTMFKNEENGEYVYYLNDEFRNGKPLRVSAKDLLPILYGRQIDGLLSKQLMEHPDFVREVSEIPDDDFVRLVQKLIGKGRDKNYEITRVDRKVIRNLVKILKGRDPKHSSLQRRIDAMNDVIDSKQKGDHVKRLLLDDPDKFENVSKLVKAIKGGKV